MLYSPRHHEEPFAHVCFQSAFGSSDCALVERVFASRGEWQHRNEAMYCCFLRDVTVELPARWLERVAHRMQRLLALPLAARVQVTAQRVEPGQRIGVHSDRPLLGYEAARLVLQLSPSWEPAHGGVLQLHRSLDGPPVAEVEPRYDTALAFVLRESSYHGVTTAHRSRRSLVFNFWHAANSPELADAVSALLSNLDFSDLPDAVDPIADRAEARLSEVESFRANLVATALQRWGYDEALVVDGYRLAAGEGPLPLPVDPERRAALSLATWVARLYHDAFDVDGWETLAENLDGLGPFDRLEPLWGLCLPAQQ